MIKTVKNKKFRRDMSLKIKESNDKRVIKLDKSTSTNNTWEDIFQDLNTMVLNNDKYISTISGEDLNIRRINSLIRTHRTEEERRKLSI